MENETKHWQTVIRPDTGWRDFHLRDIWQYRDLLMLLVKRDFKTMYKQTILGPLWLLLSPLLTTLISAFVFGGIAKIPSDGVPYFLFYLCGSTAWNFFARSLTTTSTTFVSNARLFGKVYFPRLIVPLSTVITGLLQFLIQFVLFLVFLLYFALSGAAVRPNAFVLLLPILLLQMALLGLGLGIIVSSLTVKYRDLTVLVSFGVSLWMYVTPLIYSTTLLSPGLRMLCLLNPMAPLMEIMRYAFLGTGTLPLGFWGISLLVTGVILFIGILLFQKVEKTFMDTV